MERSLLLKQLDLVAPALAENDTLPALSCFNFNGNTLTAYNDRIGITVPAGNVVGFQGLVRGKLLVDLLKASSARDVEIEKGEGIVNVKVGASKIKIGSVGSDKFPFTMPQMDKKASCTPKRSFYDALETCLRSVVNTSNIVDHLGVTLIPGTKLYMYSTNGATMTKVAHHDNTLVPDRVILSGEFCTQMLRLHKQDEKCRLMIGKDYALFQSEDRWLYGRLIESKSPLPFESTVQKFLPSTAKFFDVPPRMPLMLDRASLLAKANPDKVAVQITVNKDGKAAFVTKSEFGEVIDIVKFDGHAPVELRISPSRLRAGCEHYSKVMFTDKCAVFSGDNGTVFMVASLS
jgi:hypothetical protein